MLFRSPSKLTESYSSGFNLLDSVVNKTIDPNDIGALVYTSSDEDIAIFEQLDADNDGTPEWYLVPTGNMYGRITITITNTNNNYKGTYEVMVVPKGAVVSPTVAAGVDSTVALRGDGSVWMWGQYSPAYDANGYSLTYEYPTEVVFNGMPEGDYIIDVAAGDYHFLAIDNKGNLWGWGRNNYGQLARTASNNKISTQTIVAEKSTHFGPNTTIGEVRVIAGGAGFSVVVARKDNQVYTFGNNTNGTLGNGTMGASTSTSVPVRAGGVQGRGSLNNISSVAAGNNFAMALRADGTVYAWGCNTSGQLGNPVTATVASSDGKIQPYATTPVQVSAGESDPVAYYITNVVRIAAGAYHAVALRGDGKIYTWGYNGSGQLGNGTVNTSTQNNNRTSPVLVHSADGLKASSITAGGSHTLARFKDASGTDFIGAWGLNSSGQLGQSDVSNKTVPSLVKLGDGWKNTGDGYFHDMVAFAAGERHTAIVDWTAGVYMMGSQGWGKFNAGNSDPVIQGTLAGQHGIKELTRFGGEGYSIIQWLDNAKANGLGGTPIDKHYTMQVNVSGDTALDVYVTNDTLTLPLDGKLFYDVYEGYNLLTTVKRYPITAANAIIRIFSSDPSVVTGVMDANNANILVTAHNKGKATLYINIEYSVAGSNIIYTLPLLLQFSVTEVDYGMYNGKNNTANAIAVPMVATGAYHSVALKADGTVYTWGYNGYGQLGDNSATDRHSPVRVIKSGGGYLTNIVAVAAGDNHSLALDANGAVWAWGKSDKGACGTSQNQVAAVKAFDLTNSNIRIAAIAAGNDFSVALDNATGNVWFWGLNVLSELRSASAGDNLIEYFTSPQRLWSGAVLQHSGAVITNLNEEFKIIAIGN